ncbi:phosphate ABC transporter substrate-binding protein [Aliiglaciecola sp. LCG003]|uniref:PstS family phosphate ABC transporter substrate-binding protein n=1 Tax=Aliiglaciecola sp. LCG003 TaxID=3053655 RepID=UPI0025739B32|nr:phosphate ABC transporter substrate-binding protein [Aliiglaciecola sp. LCG003]WJG11328.1 phosphate ABC transporter substrate-binding protein [Aliiglaciecola sp. LCG003]
MVSPLDNLVCAQTFEGPNDSSVNRTEIFSRYQKQPGVAGSITSVGSDTLANLMTSWSVEFRRLYPQVKFQIQASGSSTAPPALTEGTANIGPMSREMKTSEISYFSRRHGYKPYAVKVGIDAIALFVDTNNPLEGLTKVQVDSIFSATRFCGASKHAHIWNDVGVSGSYGSKPIKIFGRNSVSGTYGLFKHIALCDGDFKATVNELPGSASVVQSVAFSNGAIGYAAYGHKTTAVKALAIADQTGAFIPASSQTIANGDYPFTRFLYLVVNKHPTDPLPLLEQEFLRFVLSDKGQQIVQQEGYVGMPNETIQRQLKALLN